MTRKKTDEKDPRQTLVTTSIVIVVAAALSAGLAIGLRQIWRSITGREEFRIRQVDFVFLPESAARWIRAEQMKNDFLRRDTTCLLRGGAGIFTSRLAQQVAAACEASPWVKRVVSVRKEFPNRVIVKLDMREPFALVRVRGNTYCLDTDACPLSPSVYNLAPDRTASLNPVVVLPDSCEVPLAGRNWDDLAVREGLAMVRLCREKFGKSLAIRQIEIQTDHIPGATPVAVASLTLEAGPQVKWGRTPGSRESTVEVKPLDKAAALLAITRREGPGLKRFKSIDLRWANPLCE